MAKTHVRFTLPAIVGLAVLCLIAITETARAEILISPTRVVLNESQQSMELVVVNRGDETFAYRVTLENMRMLEDGSIETAPDTREDELFAGEIVRFSPRRLILRPDEEQVLRVFARVRGLADGEYRSHLRLRSAPTSAGSTLDTFTTDQGDNLTISLTQIRSITLPVIVRSGDLDATAAIDGATIDTQDDGTDQLKIQLSRTGSQSVYGDIQIYGPQGGEPVYFARGIALYTPNTTRSVNLPLPDEIRDQLAGQEIKITYVSSDPNRPAVLASYEGRL